KRKEESTGSKVIIAEGLWIKCDSCKEIIYRAEVERGGRVCPKCHYPFRISARERIGQLADAGSFEERETGLTTTDPLTFKDTKKYRERVRAAAQKTSTGGGTASFAMLGDVIMAEPRALIGFAGPRVIAETIRQPLPEGFQRSEFLLAHGQLDMIVERRDLKDTLRRILAFFAAEPPRS